MLSAAVLLGIPGSPGTGAFSAVAQEDPVADTAAPAAHATDVREEIRHRLEAPPPPAEEDGPPREWPGAISAGGESLRATPWVLRFYEGRSYRPAWSDGSGPRPALDSLLSGLRQAELEGLRPRDYHLRTLSSLLAAVRFDRRGDGRPNPRELADLDLLATDAYLTYASHLLSGVVDPVTLDATSLAVPREKDLVADLSAALETGRIQASLRSLYFASHPGYFRLRSALARYRALAETDWPRVPEGDTLRPGHRGKAVATLRERLKVTDDLPDGPVEGHEPRSGMSGGHAAGADAADIFDAALEEGVRRFQRRHGLREDGIVGPATLRALNVPARDRVRQLELNLERWRWLPQDLGARYILVNIAAFQVEVIERFETVMRMRAVVGREYRQTPVFSDTMTYLVVNPSWTVPRGIAVRDKLPLVREDPGQLDRFGYKLFSDWGSDARPVNPDTVDWSEMTADRFREMRLWQAPGPHNALGRIKFMFPNRFDVYLHDTPERELFGRVTRDASSGCIRVENPLALAAYLLRDKEGWTRDRIERLLAGGSETTVGLPRPIPIHIQYWTAWTEPDGSVQFREDIYGRDRGLEEALVAEYRGIPSRRFR